ncbi:MAG: acylphosphatase [Chloroflexi bacterium]|nr:acylphosphatase [Anaerolineaceae bacterium]NMB89644.1 acylphosphatase [Chloroflexota bacterium]
MESSANSRLHAIVDGHVQGVGYRAFVYREALNLNLTGWVRNLSNGQVEVVAEGGRPTLDQLLTRLRRGPQAALVSFVQPEWLPATGEFRHFDVRSTYFD